MGVATVPAVCRAGQAFALNCKTGRLVYLVKWLGSRRLILAAAGALRGEARQVLQAIEHQARQDKAAALVFQTARPGLVRQAQREGYRVTGWILEKGLSNDPQP